MKDKIAQLTKETRHLLSIVLTMAILVLSAILALFGTSSSILLLTAKRISH
jgi:hypothetical protein